MKGRLVICAAAAVAAVGWAPLTSADSAPDALRSYGFVIERLGPALHKGPVKEDCPEGLALSVTEAFLATQSPAERERLQKTENAAEFAQKWSKDFIIDKAGRNICTNLDEFPERAVQPPSLNRISVGMDLDGGAKGAGCAHEEYRTQAGETGVDNQYQRALGCNRVFRGPDDPKVASDVVLSERGGWYKGGATGVVILRGVDDWRNDPSVEFIVASSPGPTPIDTLGAIVEGGSLKLTPNPRWRNVARARIVDGVVITEPMDIDLFVHWSFADDELNMKRARFRLKLGPDGSLEGMGGAYRPIDNIVANDRDNGPYYASIANIDCAGMRNTLAKYADGDRDPVTGRCTTVSTAMSLKARPAYVFDGGVMVAGIPSRPLRTADKGG